MKHTCHPCPDDDGKPVFLTKPSTPSAMENWAKPHIAACVIPGGAMPVELNGVPFAPWCDVPNTLDAWNAVAGQADVNEPAFQCPKDKAEAAGVVICESDGRVWLVSPSNEYGGYRNTFPKGRIEKGSTRQAAAIQEAYEESGLQVHITGFLADSLRTLTCTRYYLARRVGGTPAAMGWETQAVRLVPLAMLSEFLHHKNDQSLRLAIEKILSL